MHVVRALQKMVCFECAIARLAAGESAAARSSPTRPPWLQPQLKYSRLCDNCGRLSCIDCIMLFLNKFSAFVYAKRQIMNWIAAGEGMGFVAESFQYPQVGAGRVVP